MKLKAGMREKENGSIEYRFVIDGKRYSVTAKSVKEVLKKEQDLRVKVATGEYMKSSDLTLDQYYSEWIERKRAVIKGSTVRGYVSTYTAYISPEIGNMRLTDIDRRIVIKVRDSASKKISPQTTNRVVMILSQILSEAVSDEIITKNPAQKIPRLRQTSEKATKTIHRAFTPAEQTAFMKEAKNEWYYEAIALMLCTGMRSGEIMALSWNDIDRKSNVIHITKTVSIDEHCKKVVQTPKTKSSARDIPLTPQIIEILRSQKEKTECFNTIPIDRRIFLSCRGNSPVPHTINATFDRILRRMQENGYPIERVTSHCLRDTFATRFIEQGGNMNTLKTLLGHTSLSMTMDLYAHVLPDTKEKEMNMLKIQI